MTLANLALFRVFNYYGLPSLMINGSMVEEKCQTIVQGLEIRCLYILVGIHTRHGCESSVSFDTITFPCRPSIRFVPPYEQGTGKRAGQLFFDTSNRRKKKCLNTAEEISRH